MKYLNIKADRQRLPIKFFLLFVLLICGVTLLYDVSKRQDRAVYAMQKSPETIKTGSVSDDSRNYIPQVSDAPRRNLETQEAADKIQGAYDRVGSPISDKIPWLVVECEKRGLNPYLVAAVQAKESGWGRSGYCKDHYNCFGYGITDSGPMSEWLNFDNYEQGTSKILDFYAQYYKVDSAEAMAAQGYNFHSEWVAGVNEIKSYFN